MDRFAALWQQPVRWWFALPVIAALSLSLLIGVTRISNGNTTPPYADSGDPYSEGLIRNTVINNVIGTENRDTTLIWTRGYAFWTHGYGDKNMPASQRFDYYPDHTIRYYSNRGLQSTIYTAIARATNSHFIAHQALYFQLFRFMSCLLFTLCIAQFFGLMLKKRPLYLVATTAMALTSGATLFAANLYFQYWTMFLPLLAMPLLIRQRTGAYLATAFVGSLTNFSIHYEFATTFTLMWLLPIVITHHDRPWAMAKLGAAAFIAVCLGFMAAVAWHVVSVMQLESTDLSGASALVFEKLQTRVASLAYDVPRPLSIGMIKNILSRFTIPALYVEDVMSIANMVVAAAFAVLCLIDRSRLWRMVALWAVITYASWYLFAYQHIMQHFHYDTMLFTATITLVTVLRLFAGKADLWKVSAA